MDFGFEELIEYDEKYKEFIPTREYEESKIEGYIKEYDNFIFWQDLQGRLARRDAVKELGYTGQDKKAFEEMMKKQFNIEEKYEKEFCENGIENVRVELKNK